MRKLLVLFVVLPLVTLLSVCVLAKPTIVDRHVHIMSPALIKYWKDAGVPFSREEKSYSDLDTISTALGTDRMYLVSMAHTWNHPEFGEVEDEAKAVSRENDYVFESAKSFPGKAKVFCSVNPLRDHALDEVKRCEQKGAFGVKFHHNANQIYLTEPDHLRRVLPIWEFAAKKKLRVLLHFDNGHRKFGADDVELLFNEILSKIKPVRLQVAHMGTSGGFGDRTVRVVDAFRNEMARASFHNRKHKIVFDISAVALDKDSSGVNKLDENGFRKLAELIRETGVKYFVFGTDYPLYSADEYTQILSDKVGLTKKEIGAILKNDD